MSTTRQHRTDDDEPESLYDNAKAVSLDKYLTTAVINFAGDTYEQVTDNSFRGRRIKVAEIRGYRKQEKLELLLVHRDGTRQFVGEDDTAKDSGRFSFVIDPAAGDPPVRTCDEALDLLKPAAVTEATIETDTTPGRQGEWWLIPTDSDPAGSMFKPGVNKKPYGGSPLENHVPREYGLGVSDEAFMARFERETGIEKDAIETPHDVFEWARKQQQFRDDDLIGVPVEVPTFEELREWAEEVYVRGTLRHRENDHYLTNIGEEWHLAKTHQFEVYTPDSGRDDDDDGLRYVENDDGWMESRRRRRNTSRRAYVD